VRVVPAIARLFPDAKVIACVRELPWVIDSIERLVQRNVFSPSSIFNYSAGGTVYTRANGVASADGMVGAPPPRTQTSLLRRAKRPPAAGPICRPHPTLVGLAHVVFPSIAIEAAPTGVGVAWPTT